MNGKIRMVVFDMAGTTVDENNLVYKTLQMSLQNAGISCTLGEVLLHGAGKEKRNAIVDIIGYLSFPSSISDIDAIFSQFKKDLAFAYENATVIPQKDAEELFRILHEQDVVIVLNTGYDSVTANSLLVKLNWKAGDTFHRLITASDVLNGRPNPDMIHLAMQQFNITDPSVVAKVGDSIIDIQEGQNANCGLVVGITTGAHSMDQLRSARPDQVIENLLEILPLL